MSNDNSSVLSSICSSDLINPVYPNSSVSEVVTPCLSEVLFPAVPTALALLCPLFIWITACGNANPSLAITTLVAAKFVGWSLLDF
ncbi:hypothetical protein AAVH_33234 [Aphelenchoides avenae]|nr:hypothetical protein AAVH_33234 [Aphelenchus avenae]